jgi:ParB-like nuclease domain
MSRSKSDLTNNRSALTRETGRVALFGTSEDSEYLMLDLDQVQSNPNQPRKYFDKDALNGLASSIAERGVLQPILVKEIERGVFEIIAGERRWRASKIAGKTQIPSLVVKTDDATLLAVLENLQREDLDAVETAQALATLIKSYLDIRASRHLPSTMFGSARTAAGGLFSTAGSEHAHLYGSTLLAPGGRRGCTSGCWRPDVTLPVDL